MSLEHALVCGVATSICMTLKYSKVMATAWEVIERRPDKASDAKQCEVLGN